MGDLALMSFLSGKRERQRQLCHRQIGRGRGSITSVAKTERKGLHYQLKENVYLPEDILRLIHAMMPLRDAARAACASHIFLQSWRCRPNLIFTGETLGLIINGTGKDDAKRDFINIVQRTLLNHSGIGVKTLKLELLHFSDLDLGCLEAWLQIAVAPGIEELTLMFPCVRYKFPCSLLFERGGNSVRYLHLMVCTFRPTIGLGCLIKLTQLHLSFVWITGDELELLLSKCVALEWLKLSYCPEIICLKVPCMLRQLGSLEVAECRYLKVIEICAPNLSNFYLTGFLVRTSFENPLLVKKLRIMCLRQGNFVSYARTKLPSLVPNVETLTVASNEIVKTPIVPGKFLHLKHLHVYFISLAISYDYLSLISFFEASPSLETFMLSVTQRRIEHDSVFGESFHPREMSEHHHKNLKSVKIIGFCSAKSMIELTCHILQNTSSLECLTLDTTDGATRCCVTEYDKCLSMDNDILTEAHEARCAVAEYGKCISMDRDVIVDAHKSLLAIITYVEGKVPPTVKLNVVEPCSRCHAVEL
uniref:At1g61320/AtMIF1 LRR domain-containing protein n=1 Tax=Oryza glumipatula TaxID=40148 RepID=A0A0D9YXR7_9ORYZ